MSIKNRLAPTALLILAQFKRVTNRITVARKLGFDKGITCNTVNRLKRGGLLEIVPMASNATSPVVWMKITPKGLAVLKLRGVPAKGDFPHSGAYSRAKARAVATHVAPEDSVRNPMNSPPYVPPIESPPRANSLAYKSIPSKGLT